MIGKHTRTAPAGMALSDNADHRIIEYEGLFFCNGQLVLWRGTGWIVVGVMGCLEDCHYGGGQMPYLTLVSAAGVLDNTMPLEVENAPLNEVREIDSVEELRGIIDRALIWKIGE